jgi:hypothetical protein
VRDAGGRDEHQATDPFGLGRGELRSEETTQRMRRDVGWPDAGGVEPVREPRAHLRDAPPTMEMRQVDNVQRAPRGERLEDGRPPAPRAGEPVHQHERLTRSQDAVPDEVTVDVDLAQLGRDDRGHHASSPTSASGGAGGFSEQALA